jgi:hypothetical protein
MIGAHLTFRLVPTKRFLRALVAIVIKSRIELSRQFRFVDVKNLFDYDDKG